jgi:hypothetical protein
MSKLIILDAGKVGLFSFSPECKTTEEAQAELVDKGWTNEAALTHLEAALRSGVYATGLPVTKLEHHSTRTTSRRGHEGVGED